ncbi:hypothetical protein SAMN04488109_1715 [Chryseolinea serpens]|uniref:Uncharacterized protein n=1 Tax=Chryseolinea serpens TaxID=947013 RepID=A0A1M5MFB4_9BACT|nr:hypothetical protein SAMN04488109_1715 [Chryseolinea serpens]
MPPMHMTNNTSGVISFVACIAYLVSVEDPPRKKGDPCLKFTMFWIYPDILLSLSGRLCSPALQIQSSTLSVSFTISSNVARSGLACPVRRMPR